MSTAMERLGRRRRRADGRKEKGQWNRHDLSTGKAAARRRRQHGHVVFCAKHPTNATVGDTGMCDTCLTEKFA